MPCNPTKKKQLTNHRSSNKDQTTVLNVSRKLTLDQALEWIAEDEWVEVTPKSIRMRKAIRDFRLARQIANALQAAAC